ncbi:MAG: HD-GYP domain-containing protein, partial [Eubacteriales bacterium]
MSKYNVNLLVFDASIFVSGFFLLFHYLPSPDIQNWVPVFLFSAAVLSLALLKTCLPSEESFSFENVMIIAYVLTYGFSGTWVAAIAFTGYALLKRTSLLEAVFSVSSFVIAVWGAAAIFTATGGVFGNLSLSENYVPLLCFLSSYLLFVFGSKAVYDSLLLDRPLEMVNLLKDESSITLLVVIDGVVATLLYQSVGIAGIIIVLMLTAGILKILRIYLHSERKYVKTVETFLTVTENKIPHFRGHSERVAKSCQMLLSCMRVTREERGIIEYAALLHDIGKLGMPEKLLRIHSYLTSDEVQCLEGHPEIGGKLVQQITGLDKVAELIHCHHEKYNGEGYPRKLAKEEIPFGARVIAVADMFDNLVYRVGLRFQQACTELKNMAGSDLDPEIVKVFLKVIL